MISGRGKIRPPRRMVRPIAGGNRGKSEFEAGWDVLRAAIVDIHRRHCSELQFEQLYRVGYKIVMRKESQQLYDNVRDFERSWIQDNIMTKLVGFVNADFLTAVHTKSISANQRRQLGEAFLRGLRDTWDDYNTSMNMAADILMYMDRTLTVATRCPSIFTSTIGLYRDMILKAELHGAVVHDMLISVLLDQIEMERTGDVVDRALIRSAIAMLDGLYETDEEEEHEKLYVTRFEPEFLRATEEFYAEESRRLLSQGDCPAWIHHTPKRLHEESDLVMTAIHRDSHDRIQKIIEEKLIKDHLDEFLALDTGLKWLIDNGKLHELSLLYSLVVRVDKDRTSLTRILQPLVVALGRDIQRVLQATDFSLPAAAPPSADGEEAGPSAGARPKQAQLTAAAQQTAAAIKWVDDVLGLKDKFDHIWETCFEKDLALQTALTKSFSEFINHFDRASEYVSLFIDDSLRRGIRDKTEAEVDAVLEKAIALVRYLLDKDMFERYYQRHLARRLLHSKSESHEVEKQLIIRMKQEFGNQFTHKFEGMFRDMETSIEFTTSYRDRVRSAEDAADRIDMSLSILTTNNWPSEVMGRATQQQLGAEAKGAAACTYPEEIEKLHASVKAHYLQSRSGRKLTWVANLGSADIRCVFPAIPGKSGALAKERRYEINVPTYGMIVLLLFNDIDADESLSFEEIQAKTNIPTQELTKTLTALAVAPKCRVLAKEPATKSVKEGDTFRFNTSFVSKAVRIKAPTITSVSKVEGDEERRATKNKADETRSHLIDAAVVRIMKQRRQLTHSQLITEVLDQLVGRFKPEIPMVKKRIEDLIARDYLERMEDQPVPTYMYLA